MSNILVVEDDLSLQKLIVHCLSKAGYFVMVANNGREAIEKELESQPDLLILDKMMAEMGGIELLEKLKSQYSTSYIRVIMLTSCSNIEDIVEGLDKGADDYVTKPCDLKILLARVRAQLRTKVMIDQLLRENESLKDRIAGPPREILASSRSKEIGAAMKKEKIEKAVEWPMELRKIAQRGIKEVLFLCKANIFRSPIAEFLFNRQLKRMGDSAIRAQSAGLQASPGSTLPDGILHVLSKMNINLANHRSKSITKDLAREADLILVMEKNHLNSLAELYPFTREKAFMLSEFKLDGNKRLDIVDPVGKRKSMHDYRVCCHDISLSISGVAKFLRDMKIK
ncbi:MAG: response regulator [Nitrospinae bacterium]|nr:response regulator [Nitrospinota bacterium]